MHYFLRNYRKNVKIHHFSIRLHVVCRIMQAQLPSFTFMAFLSRRLWYGVCHLSSRCEFLMENIPKQLLKIQRLSQNWCLFSLHGLITPSIRISTKCPYLVVHYLSNKHLWISVWVAFTHQKKKKKKGKKKMNENTNLFTHIIVTYWAIHLTFSFSKYRPFATINAFIILTYFFNCCFKFFLWNASKDCSGFLDHLQICFEVSAMQFTFQRCKQLEFGKPLSALRSFPL